MLIIKPSTRAISFLALWPLLFLFSAIYPPRLWPDNCPECVTGTTQTLMPHYNGRAPRSMNPAMHARSFPGGRLRANRLCKEGWRVSALLACLDDHQRNAP
jgi:hypothetical protein